MLYLFNALRTLSYDCYVVSFPLYFKNLNIYKSQFQCSDITIRKMHVKCVNASYPKTDEKIQRFSIPNSLIEWTYSFSDYLPVDYTSASILKKPSYADPDISDPNFTPNWNSLDGAVNRKSFPGIYSIVNGKPRNPIGRTGIIGRGCLGRWGPNQAADPIVTRWKLDDSGQIVVNDQTKKKILEFVSIQRRDCFQWAIPGGMVDPGEKITSTLLREFMEEALNSHQMTDFEKISAKEDLTYLFSHGSEVYSGYVDDPRNTDNSWMETVAYNFHDEDFPSGVLYKLKLQAGDDAQAVRWTDIDKDLPLYASHIEMISVVAQKLGAHW